MKAKFLAFLLVISIFVLSSCGTDDITGQSVANFPLDPDKIIVGTNGAEKEYLPDDMEYNEIISLINERFIKSERFDRAALDAYDPDSGMHLSFDLRDRETFVEFVYNECTVQRLNMLQSGGSITTEEINVSRVFFSLTRDYHDCFFIGKDANYDTSETLGILADNTTLITYVNNLFD